MERTTVRNLPVQRRPMISVIIPVLNAERTVGDQLAALASQDYEGEWELIIADNGSTDRSMDLVRRWSHEIPRVRVVDASDQVGINHARNSGSLAATGDFLIFCDADDIADTGWLRAMANAAGDADIVGGRLEDNRLNRYPTTSWELNLAEDGLPVALGFLPYAVGGNLGIRAAVLREIGGWNEKYAGGGDEVDLCWRAQLKNFALRYEPDAVMHYRYREGLWAMARQRYRYGIGSVRLYRDFHTHGIPKERALVRFRAWKRLLGQLLRSPHLLLDAKRRGLWVRDASYHLGMLVGGFRLRI
jgi:glycosyltransferase involved in cell wall biosynthesis